MENEPLRYAIYDTAVGDVTLIATAKALVGLKFGAIDIEGAINEENAVLYDGIIELNQYFFGQRKVFDLKLAPEGSIFELKVWKALLGIPYGTTKTYEEVADIIGEPKAVRAVGMANNKNPIPLFIPCHRVIGKKGDLVGYVGGLDLKKKLLLLEKQNINRVFTPGHYEDEGK